MFKIYMLLLAVATAFKLADLQIQTDDPALQSPMARKMIEEVVASELKKNAPKFLSALREEKGVRRDAKKPSSQTFEVEIRTTDGEDVLDVVVVSVWPDGTTTRDYVPS